MWNSWTQLTCLVHMLVELNWLNWLNSSVELIPGFCSLLNATARSNAPGIRQYRGMFFHNKIQKQHKTTTTKSLNDSILRFWTEDIVWLNKLFLLFLFFSSVWKACLFWNNASFLAVLISLCRLHSKKHLPLGSLAVTCLWRTSASMVSLSIVTLWCWCFSGFSFRIKSFDLATRQGLGNWTKWERVSPCFSF